MPSDEIRLVVDTNIIVSAAISVSRRKQSPERDLVGRIAEGKLTLLLSDDIFGEYEEVLSRFVEETARPHIPRKITEKILDGLEDVATFMESTPRVSLLRDPDDAKFLDLAIAGQADYLITTNLRHFPALPWIVTVHQFFVIEL